MSYRRIDKIVATNKNCYIEIKKGVIQSQFTILIITPNLAKMV